jgi:hypothetical protein
MRLWKKQSFCIKTASDWEWVGSTKGCKDGYSKCSGNICIPVSNPCPLTSLVKTTVTPGPLKIGDNFFTTTNNNGQPLVGFSLTPGGDTNNAPCFQNDLSPEFQSGLFYPLQNQPAKGCESYGMQANYAISLDNDLVNKVLEYNNFKDSISNEPLYANYIGASDTYIL